jgi:hypothetical protein
MLVRTQLMNRIARKRIKLCNQLAAVEVQQLAGSSPGLETRSRTLFALIQLCSRLQENYVYVHNSPIR